MDLTGQPAPQFNLKAHTGEDITLEQFKGSKNVVLIFYPLDFSSVCSIQLPEFSAYKDEFAEHDTVILQRAIGPIAILTTLRIATGASAAPSNKDELLAVPSPHEKIAAVA